MATRTGTAGDDTLNGTSSADEFYMDQGGTDTANGKLGNDTFFMGGAFTPGHRIDGGGNDPGGRDILTLEGDYHLDVVFEADTITGIEQILMLGGYDYDLVLHDGNVAAGDTLYVLSYDTTSSDSLRVDASAETDGYLWMYGGAGNDKFTGGGLATLFFAFGAGARGADTFTGGAGDDYMQIDETFDSGDRLDGAGGYDQIVLKSTYAGGLVITKLMMEDFEVLQFNPGTEAVFDVRLQDGVVKSGANLRVLGEVLGATALDFDGSNESNGTFSINGGASSDTIRTGSGIDILIGNDGGDHLTGGGDSDFLTGGLGADHFIYLATADSTAAASDYIVDLAADDIIDLSAIDANTGKNYNQAFNLKAAFTGKAGQAVLTYDAGAGQTTLDLDTDGDGLADAHIRMAGDQTGFTGFVW